jgi:hypothetical protein
LSHGKKKPEIRLMGLSSSFFKWYREQGTTVRKPNGRQSSLTNGEALDEKHPKKIWGKVLSMQKSSNGS